MSSTSTTENPCRLPTPDFDPASHQRGSNPGYLCPLCGQYHHLPDGEARIHARQLQKQLERERRLDIFLPSQLQNPGLVTDSLFGDERGKMFGVLVCSNTSGRQEILKAFSGQFNGHWLVDGWAPPLFDVNRFDHLNRPREREIKRLGVELKELRHNSPGYQRLRLRRRRLCQQLMHDIHALYRLNNFRNSQWPLKRAFVGGKGIPSGTGDCCAPKLLNLAARRQLTPISLAEFYWGRSNRSATREHGTFYRPCREKCAPILGFLLCGTGEQQHRLEP
jgi:hypothetical protein